jgi:hypothetical protein
MESHLEQMRGVLISLHGGKMLLPNTTVSEIISYIAPETGFACGDVRLAAC